MLKIFIKRYIATLLFIFFSGLNLLAFYLSLHSVVNFTIIFSPAHLFNSLLSFGVIPILSIIALVFLDKYFEKNRIDIWKRVALSLCLLLILTFIADIIVWGNWLSCEILLSDIFGYKIPCFDTGLNGLFAPDKLLLK